MTTDLTGQLLIAMPGMDDPRFSGSVVYLCAHSPEGTMGIIVNKRIDELTFADMLAQLEITAADPPPIPVMFGGPVETGRGFVLHSSDYLSEGNSLAVGKDFAMTATLDVLEDMANRRGPQRALMALGYAGWGGGQLEAEIMHNGWLTCDATPDLVFGTDDDRKWEAALATLGVDPLMLSASAGNA